MQRYHPMTTEEHRHRYPRAVAHVWSPDELASWAHQGGPPAVHVFDWPDGLRLIITREDHDKLGIILHVSVSGRPGSSLDGISRPNSTPLAEAGHARFLELTGQDLPADAFTFSAHGYPHWYVLEKEEG